MNLASVFEQLGIALGLGLLVGLQRERAQARVAGFRTVPLITVFGTLCALLAQAFGGWVVAAGFLALAAVIVIGNVAVMKTGGADAGLTTEAAMLVMYCVGAYLVVGYKAAAIAVGGGVAVLLQFKPELHELAGRIGDRDFKAIIQFVLISLVILPVLPNEFYGPYGVLNPFRIWTMVVLIVGISQGAYVIFKLFGENVGALVGGILGGLVSSTATTVSYSRRSRESDDNSTLSALVILISSAIVFVRVLIIIGAAAAGLLHTAAAPLAVMFAGLGIFPLGMWIAKRHKQPQMADLRNPSELKPAIIFALIFGVVLLAAAAAKQHFGERGLFAVAVLSGLVDMDAITLSICNLVVTHRVTMAEAWPPILAGAISNLVFKAAVAGIIGKWPLLRKVAPPFAAAFVIGMLILFYWPR
jgi:uncharacterized membrane protein (DUF4010 family)